MPTDDLLAAIHNERAGLNEKRAEIKARLDQAEAALEEAKTAAVAVRKELTDVDALERRLEKMEALARGETAPKREAAGGGRPKGETRQGIEEAFAGGDHLSVQEVAAFLNTKGISATDKAVYQALLKLVKVGELEKAGGRYRKPSTSQAPASLADLIAAKLSEETLTVAELADMLRESQAAVQHEINKGVGKGRFAPAGNDPHGKTLFGVKVAAAA